MPHIFIYGPPASGKSTLGKMLAARLELPFVDLDQAIESKAGNGISAIMEERGENGFRDVESLVLREQVDGPESVIALGGGTLLREGDRRLVEASGNVLCLKAESHVLLQRLKNDSIDRPLLAGNAAERLPPLLAARSNHYNSFPRQFNADQPTQDLILQFETAIGRFHLSAMGSYDAIIQEGGLEGLGEMLRARGATHMILVTDENVSKLYAARVRDSLQGAGYVPQTLIIPAGETSKTPTTVGHLWDGFFQAGLDRKSTVIALGGGVVGDLAGFAASTFMRGVEWACVPTSLLAMVDASLGGKTGFDLPQGKNLIGSFHAPRLVLADPDVLDTLPEAEFRAGLAEVVKHGIVADPQLFELCAHGFSRVREQLPEVLRRAVAVKVKIIEADPYEIGERAALNLGHTVGHAVELVSQFRIRHGEAVAMGIAAEARLAERLSIARSGLRAQMTEALSGLGLPVDIPRELPRPELIRAMYADKKRAAGTVRFALPVEIGSVQVNTELRDLKCIFEED